MEDYRKCYNYDDLRHGRMYVLNVQREAIRRECLTEDALCAAIDEIEAEYPGAVFTVIQLPATG